MKQILLRVPEEVHARVTAKAAEAGLSVNAYVTRLLELGIDPVVMSRRDRLRLRILELGAGVVPSASTHTPDSPGAPPRISEEREALLARVRADVAVTGGVSQDELMHLLGRDRDW